MQLSRSPFYQVVQKHKLFDVVYLKRLLIAYFIVIFWPKISKSVHMRQSYIASQRWDVILRHGVVIFLQTYGTKSG